MSILKQENKIIRNLSGEILTDNSTLESNKILHIDGDLQFSNRIHKNGTNQASQITDKAQNIAFTQSDDAKKFTYNYSEQSFEANGAQWMQSKPWGINIGLGDFTIEFWAKISVGAPTYNGIISSKQLNTDANTFIAALLYNTGKLYIEIGGRTLETVGNISTPQGQYGHYAICRKQINATYRTFLYVNGYLDKADDNVGVLNDDGKNLILGDFSFNNSAPLNGGIKGLSFSNYAKYPVDLVNTLQRQLFTPKEPFIYYHRYKDDGNKKIYLSSKYLKDAVIDETDQITSIKDSIKNYTFDSAGHEIELTKYGFKSDNAYSNSEQSSELVLGSNNFYIGIWVNLTNTVNQGICAQSGTNTEAGTAWAIFVYNNILAFQVSDGSTWYYTTIPVPTLNKYVYLTLLRFGDILYILQNGVLLSTITLPTNLILNLTQDRVTVGGYTAGGGFRMQGGSFDDFLFSNGSSLIVPTGYAVGGKVFEPPMRGGFEDYVIQYPVGGGEGYKVYL